MLSPGSGINTHANPVTRYKRIVDQAKQLGVQYIIDFGLHGDDSAEAYVELMREVAPYAAEKDMHISMKLHDVPKDISAPVLGPLTAIHDAINHPNFGLCMDPGNVIYYTAAASKAKGGEGLGSYRLPTEGLAAQAHRFNTFIIKDAIVEAGGMPDVMVQPGEGLVDFAVVLATLRRAGFSGPICLEKVPGYSLAVVNANFRKARKFMHKLESGAVL